MSISSEYISDTLALGTMQNTFQKLHPSFTQLRSLNLQFSENTASPHTQSIVDVLESRAKNFPHLRKLIVRNPPVDVRTVIGAFYRRKAHSSLRQFEVECSVALVGNIMALDFGRHVDGAESVAVGCVGLGQLPPERADRMAKQMLGSLAHGLRSMRLTIAAQLPVRLGSVVMQCSQLRSLELRMPVTLADVSAVVHQLPCLWRLKAPYIATANLPSDEVRSLDRFYTLMTAGPSQKLMKPISRSLEIVHVGFWDYRHSARALCCHLLHFIVRLPTLRTLVHDAQSAIALQSAVDALALIHQRQSPIDNDGSAVIERTLSLDGAIDNRPILSRQDILEIYEVDRTAEVVNEGPDGENGYSRIALQFPDELLPDSTLVSEELQKRIPGHAQVFILADTSYGSCCVDEVAAEHYSADIIIHYGRTCLSLSSRTPVYYVFGRENIDSKDCAQKTIETLEPGQNILLMCDVPYAYAMDDIAKELRTCGKDKLGDVVLCEISVLGKPYVPSSNEIIRPGRRWKLGENRTISDYTILYVGGESLTLTNIMVTERAQSIYSYDPRRTQTLREETSKVNRHLNRRYYMVQRAKDANIIGIVVGTLAALRYLRVVEALKQMLRKAGKKYYVFVVGKLNVAKLANFAEIETFILVACPENSLVDSKDFYQPVVTPYEMLLAISHSRQWTGDYVNDFHTFLDEAQLHEEEEKESDEDLPHFSLITGTLKQNRRYNHPKDNSRVLNTEGSSALVKQIGDMQIRNKNTEIAEYMGSAGAEYLMNRSFRGLGHDDSEHVHVEPMKAVEGLSGIARGYDHEKKQS
ncbi:Diphthamide biosynthesis protein 2 [Coemansia sp. RSA 1365]|nr:Diphthamide biosynthesis protein 2 [Coemansia sp. RSA 1365]